MEEGGLLNDRDVVMGCNGVGGPGAGAGGRSDKY